MSLNLYQYHINPESVDGYEQAKNNVPRVAWERFYNNRKELKKREYLWAKSAEHSYLYALKILGRKRFKRGEPAIATSAEYSYDYALFVHGPFELGEPTIATSDEFSYKYAFYILGGPFELGEPTIATSARYSYLYARDVLDRRRFILGEPAIRGSDYQEYYEKMVRDNVDPDFKL